MTSQFLPFVVMHREHIRNTFLVHYESAQKMSRCGHTMILWTISCVKWWAKKRVVLFPPNEINHLYVEGSSSRVIDIDSVEQPHFKDDNSTERNLFPKFSRIKQRFECVLNPGEVLIIPALWFHNVLSLEASISVNIFWKHLNDEFYEKKDLYGNKDIFPAQLAMKEADKLCQTLASIPPYYREFYIKKITAHWKSTLLGSVS